LNLGSALSFVAMGPKATLKQVPRISANMKWCILSPRKLMLKDSERSLTIVCDGYAAVPARCSRTWQTLPLSTNCKRLIHMYRVLSANTAAATEAINPGTLSLFFPAPQ
jgi:hypothetical protein